MQIRKHCIVDVKQSLIDFIYYFNLYSTLPPMWAHKENTIRITKNKFKTTH